MGSTESVSDITSFKGEYAFLSNFYYSPITCDGEFFSTVEHAYQASKAVAPFWRETIRLQQTPGKAKRMGRDIIIRDDWEEIKDEIMEKYLRLKFAPETKFAQKLIDTGDVELIEGNTWGDDYWGAYWEGQHWIGQNKLGQLLMKIRSDLNAESN